MKPNSEYMLILGMLSLAISSVFAYLDLRYLQFSISSFMEGLFSGLAIVLIFSHLVRLRKYGR